MSTSVQWFAKADRTLSSRPEALEVGVEVSGTHAKGGAGTRELFSENTLTTLVFEDGVVVRLSAAVVDGQLLFLKHLGSQKEIVTRVLRQRNIGPGSAYVELEFTEAALGFWKADLELPRPEAAAQESAMEAAAREFLASAPPQHEAQAPAAMPNEEEVALLREEIAALRSQMGSMLESASTALPTELSAPTVAAEDMGSVITTLLGAPPSAPVARAEVPSVGENLTSEMSVEALPGNRVVMPWRLIAAIVALAFVSGIASQKGLLSEWFGKRKATVATAGAADSSGGNSHAAARPAAAKTAAATTSAKTPLAGATLPEGASTSSASDAAATNASLREAAARELDARNAHDPGDVHEANDVEASRKPERNSGSPSRGNLRSANVDAADAAPASAANDASEAYEPPNLIKAVSAVAPPEAVRGFVTGDVKMDALVDAAGRVASASVVSGPKALRAAALEAVRGYQYKPATKNGQPVSGHVSVTMKFWYEP